MTNDLEFLKEVLSVPTKTGKEQLMVNYIVKWLHQNNIEYYTDVHKNIYATKISQNFEHNDDMVFPCVISHTDTVHNIDTINVREVNLKNAQGITKLALKGYNDLEEPTGIGGDDKCGVFACLKLLKESDFLKAAFFVSEENGCNGSKYADPDFFQNVGYAIQFDAPFNNLVTETCFGVKLFDRGSEFFTKCDTILTESYSGNLKYMAHPYTDVYALKKAFDFSCINISIGYYDYHTENEYVVVEDTFNGIEVGRKLISELGYNKYGYSNKEANQFENHKLFRSFTTVF